MGRDRQGYAADSACARCDGGAEVSRRSGVAEDSKWLAVRPGVERVHRRRRSRVGAAAPRHARSGREDEGGTAGSRVHRRRHVRSCLGWTGARLRMAIVRAWDPRGPERLRVDRRQRHERPSDTEVQERRQLRDAGRTRRERAAGTQTRRISISRQMRSCTRRRMSCSSRMATATVDHRVRR